MNKWTFSLLPEAPPEAMMASKVKCRIKTALVSLPVVAIDAVPVPAAVEAKSVLMWIVVAGMIAVFGYLIRCGHMRGWKTDQ